ncbi:hypothetical protein I4F81_006322 [Pyropia yezoensis]|uniref:Uncharacterized protein n=1 Tax=Pyropia yezoensis TaxID=2788 RepID=A0ACC3C0Y7_PYRYE|nr:hypothetical protein I4F81_006322 [Neopyropia yezoensis]
MASDEPPLSAEGVNALVSFIIRPPRATYPLTDLGARTFTVGGTRVNRTDVELRNGRGLRLQASHYVPEGGGPGWGASPVSSPRASPVAATAAGSEASSGALPHTARSSAAAAPTAKASRVALYGHSMGAATALMYAGRPDPAVAGLLLDSPYASFDKLASSMVAHVPLPPGVPRRLVLSFGVRAVRKAVREAAGFDVTAINPAATARRTTLPVLLIHGSSDSVVEAAHSVHLHRVWAGSDKELMLLPGVEHDSPRPPATMDSAFVFLQRVLRGEDRGAMATVLRGRGNEALVSGRAADAVLLYTQGLAALAELGKASQTAQPGGGGKKGSRVGGMVGMAAALLPSTDALPPLGADPPSTLGGSNAHHPLEAVGLAGTPPTPLIGTATSNDRASASSVDGGFAGGAGTGSTATASSGGARGRRMGASLRSLVGRVNSGVTGGLDRIRTLGRKRGEPPPSGATAASAPPSPSGGSVRGGSLRGGIGGGAVDSSSPSLAATGVAPGGHLPPSIGGLTGRPRSLAVAMYGNRSLGHARLGSWAAAIADADAALGLDPGWVRGYLRRATALAATGDTAAAAAAVEAGLSRDGAHPGLLAMRGTLRRQAADAAATAAAAAVVAAATAAAPAVTFIPPPTQSPSPPSPVAG